MGCLDPVNRFDVWVLIDISALIGRWPFIFIRRSVGCLDPVNRFDVWVLIDISALIGC